MTFLSTLMTAAPASRGVAIVRATSLTPWAMMAAASTSVAIVILSSPS
jgi:hypothetical protein